MSEEADVVVIGSGAGGAPVAKSLAEAGASVLMLERGERYTREDFVHDEIRIARRNFFEPPVETDPHVLVADGSPPRRTRDGWVSVCVGGGTVHMSGFFYRFLPVDYRVRTFLGGIDGAEHADWPITYDEMAPYYDRVEREMGVSGPASEGAFAAPRSSPYPLPPVETHPAARLIDEAAVALGVHSFPTPRAIITRDREGRGRCTYCHLCGGFGCEVGAKSSTLDAVIPAAEATGRFRLLARARVTQIETGPGGRATGVVYRDAGGVDRRVRARVVVVAASCVETARLLLLSTSPAHPDGLGNAEGQVGRHLMFSTLSKSYGSFRFATDPARAEILRDHAPFLGRSILDYYTPASAAVRKAGALNLLLPPGGPIFQSERAGRDGAKVLWGAALEERLREYWREQKQIDCEAFGEYLPTPGTHVTLDPEVKDAIGLPVARMTIDRHPHDLEVSTYLAARAAELLERAGADRVWTDNIGGRTMHLPMGACRMGDDPASSVVDRDCRVHSVPNLYIADGSVFPSSGGVPPTHTILANSLRVGDAIAGALASGEL